MRSMLPLLLALACTAEEPAEPGATDSPTAADTDTDPDVDPDTDTDADSDAAPDTGADTGFILTVDSSDSADTGGSSTSSDDPYADCTAVYADSSGYTVVYEYDGHGHLLSYETSTGHWVSYVNTTVGGLLVEQTYTASDGTSGTATYDEHEHMQTSSYEGQFVTIQLTHDAAGLLTRSEVTNNGHTTVTTFDHCESTLQQTLSGGQINDYVHTYASGCLLSRTVLTTSTGYVTTYTYDSLGRHATTDFGTSTATVTYTCP
jgi:hypothetical protein